MKAYQIFQSISAELGQSIFQDLRDEHKEIYRSTQASLAQQKRLRPVFIQRKSTKDQIEWMYKTCKQKAVDSIVEHVLQIWLLKSKQELLTEFLEQLGIDHDDDGTVEDLPDELDEKKLKSAVDVLIKKHSPEVVAVYLHMFQLQRPDGWEVLAQLLESDERLKLGEEEEVADEAPSKAAATAEASAKDESPVESEAAESEEEVQEEAESAEEEKA